MSELTVLQAVRLKGRLSQADLAATLGEDPDDLVTTLGRLTDAGLLISGNTLRISPEGRERLNALLAQERSAIEPGALAKTYDDFRVINAVFKELISDWQIKHGQPNAHDDEEYDAAVLARLDEVHQRVSPIIEAAASQLPRLNAYADKLSSALEKVKAGETTWLARPIIDSYHTVWFELHEELLVAAGLSREDEARAGHAT
ncbi:MarR family transcriptional regulator [Mycobacterium avium]|uniref:MarR family transcriptional regulator n=1 Tax=Mycobacterium avium TaxID=1764 RepID=UPI000A010CC9|nr:MarR family transcriptional regulator [Mycobacterium avium]